jgi:hypothetical protein
VALALEDRANSLEADCSVLVNHGVTVELEVEVHGGFTGKMRVLLPLDKSKVASSSNFFQKNHPVLFQLGAKKKALR